MSPRPSEPPSSTDATVLETDQRPRTALEIADYIDASIHESVGDPVTMGETLLFIIGHDDLHHVASECGLSIDVLRRQLTGKRTLTFSTVLGAMRALGVELRASVYSREGRIASRRV